MLIRIRKLALYLLLACLPLQSMAAPARTLFCDETKPGAAASSHVHDDGEDRAAHDALDGPGGFSAHDCCHYYFTGVVSRTFSAIGLKAVAFEPGRLASYYSFVPERLKRPPLALAA